MNWLKVLAVVIGGLLAFFIVGSLVHLITAILGWVLVIALVAGGGYVAYKVVSAGERRAIGSGRRRRRPERRYEDREVREDYSRTDYGSSEPGPSPRRPASDVDDELSRLKREMGR